MPDVAPHRVRIALTPPQAVPETSGLLFQPAADRGGASVILAPGSGSDLLHPVLVAVGKALAESGHPTLLFNFAFTEAARKRPDPTARLERAYSDVVGWLRDRLGAGRPLVLGGRSLGGRVASRLAASGVECAGLVLLGYPLHPRTVAQAAPQEQRLRTEHWSRLRVPTLFVQGDRDPLCALDVLSEQLRAHLAQVDTEVHTIAGGDHAFQVRARDARSAAQVLQEVSTIVVDWVERHVPPSAGA